MTGLLAAVLAIGLADSLNPATIAVAIVLAVGGGRFPRLLCFALGTGITYFLGGLVLLLGPAGLLHSLLHHKPSHAGYIAEIVVGALAIGGGVWIWTREPDSVERHVPTALSPVRALLLAAGITIVDLPTALMYFAAIALIARANISTASEIGLLVAFNVAYVLPLLATALLAGLLGEEAERLLDKLHGFVLRWGQRLLALLTAGGGAYILAKGIAGLAG